MENTSVGYGHGELVTLAQILFNALPDEKNLVVIVAGFVGLLATGVALGFA